MPSSQLERSPVERLDEIRALAPHITYMGLLRWFDTLPPAAPDAAIPRRAVSETGVRYDVVRIWRRLIESVVSMQMTRVDQPDTKAFFRGRQSPRWDRQTNQLVYFPRDWLSREHLMWRSGKGGSLDLIAPGTVAGTQQTPAIITVDSRDPLTIAQAESLVLDAAPSDPTIQSPAYTVVPLIGLDDLMR